MTNKGDGEGKIRETFMQHNGILRQDVGRLDLY